MPFSETSILWSSKFIRCSGVEGLYFENTMSIIKQATSKLFTLFPWVKMDADIFLSLTDVPCFPNYKPFVRTSQLVVILPWHTCNNIGFAVDNIKLNKQPKMSAAYTQMWFVYVLFQKYYKSLLGAAHIKVGSVVWKIWCMLLAFSFLLSLCSCISLQGQVCCSLFPAILCFFYLPTVWWPV